MKALLKRGQNGFGQQKRFTPIFGNHDDDIEPGSKNYRQLCEKSQDNDFSDHMNIIEC